MPLDTLKAATSTVDAGVAKTQVATADSAAKAAQKNRNDTNTEKALFDAQPSHSFTSSEKISETVTKSRAATDEAKKASDEHAKQKVAFDAISDPKLLDGPAESEKQAKALDAQTLTKEDAAKDLAAKNAIAEKTVTDSSKQSGEAKAESESLRKQAEQAETHQQKISDGTSKVQSADSVLLTAKTEAATAVSEKESADAGKKLADSKLDSKNTELDQAREREKEASGKLQKLKDSADDPEPLREQAVSRQKELDKLKAASAAMQQDAETAAKNELARAGEAARTTQELKRKSDDANRQIDESEAAITKLQLADGVDPDLPHSVTVAQQEELEELKAAASEAKQNLDGAVSRDSALAAEAADKDRALKAKISDAGLKMQTDQSAIAATQSQLEQAVAQKEAIKQADRNVEDAQRDTAQSKLGVDEAAANKKKADDDVTEAARRQTEKNDDLTAAKLKQETAVSVLKGLTDSAVDPVPLRKKAAEKLVEADELDKTVDKAKTALDEGKKGLAGLEAEAAALKKESKDILAAAGVLSKTLEYDAMAKAKAATEKAEADLVILQSALPQVPADIAQKVVEVAVAKRGQLKAALALAGKEADALILQATARDTILKGLASDLDKVVQPCQSVIQAKTETAAELLKAADALKEAKEVKEKLDELTKLNDANEEAIVAAKEAKDAKNLAVATRMTQLGTPTDQLNGGVRQDYQILPHGTQRHQESDTAERNKKLGARALYGVDPQYLTQKELEKHDSTATQPDKHKIHVANATATSLSDPDDYVMAEAKMRAALKAQLAIGPPGVGSVGVKLPLTDCFPETQPGPQQRDINTVCHGLTRTGPQTEVYVLLDGKVTTASAVPVTAGAGAPVYFPVVALDLTACPDVPTQWRDAMKADIKKQALAGIDPAIYKAQLELQMVALNAACLLIDGGGGTVNAKKADKKLAAEAAIAAALLACQPPPPVAAAINKEPPSNAQIDWPAIKVAQAVPLAVTPVDFTAVNNSSMQSYYQPKDVTKLTAADEWVLVTMYPGVNP